MSRVDVRQSARRLFRPAILPLLVLFALASSCGRFHRGDDLDSQATIVFVNQSMDQADVFAVASSSESIRIGTVMPGQTATLTVPATFTNIGTVEIVARVLARSFAPRTGPVSLGAGNRYRVTLPVDERTLVLLPDDR